MVKSEPKEITELWMTEAVWSNRQRVVSPVIHSLGEKCLQVVFYVFFAWAVSFSFSLLCPLVFRICMLSCVFLHLSPSKMDSDNNNQVELIFALLLCCLRGFNLRMKCSWTRPWRPLANVNLFEFSEEWDRQTDRQQGDTVCIFLCERN